MVKMFLFNLNTSIANKEIDEKNGSQEIFLAKKKWIKRWLHIVEKYLLTVR